MERRISPRNQANSPVFSIRSERTRVGGERAPSAAQFTKKTTSASGGRLLFALVALRATELQASLPAEMWAITQKCDQALRHQKPLGSARTVWPPSVEGVIDRLEGLRTVCAAGP